MPSLDETISTTSRNPVRSPFSPSHVAQAASIAATTAATRSPPSAAMNGVATEASQRRSPPRCCCSENGCHRAAATPTAAASAAAQRSWKQATGRARSGTSSVPMAQRLPKRRMAGMVLEWKREKGGKQVREKDEMPTPPSIDGGGESEIEEERKRRKKERLFLQTAFFFPLLFFHPPSNEQTNALFHPPFEPDREGICRNATNIGLGGRFVLSFSLSPKIENTTASFRRFVFPPFSLNSLLNALSL